MKIGILKEGFEKCEVDVETMVKDAANSLKQKGAIVEEISVPMHATGNLLVFLVYF